ncbi:hypothetical protein C7M84_012242 [Penaeus vannamei]|uniref:Uncharacterized protein n=1 Tax=Penaeus vannamei TaxID=6689 RepID=A0A3R7Q642_PENVA|nr:hypothetical protein C7M84_012242 [Penaeus vannamei]
MLQFISLAAHLGDKVLSGQPTPHGEVAQIEGRVIGLYSQMSDRDAGSNHRCSNLWNFSLQDVALDGDVLLLALARPNPKDIITRNPTTNTFLPQNASLLLSPPSSTTLSSKPQSASRQSIKSTLSTEPQPLSGNRFVTQTVPSPPVVQTRFVTSTRVVPQVNYVTRTQVQTQVVPVEVTSTQVRTIIQPLTNYQTQERQATRVVTVPGRDVVQTRVQTVVQTSIVRSQQPAITRFVTSTRVQQVVTRTNIATQTRILTQVVPQEVVRTQVVPTTIYTTLFETRVQPFTRVQTVVRTQYVTPVPVVQTRQEVRTSVVQVPGQDRVVNREVVQTQQRQQVVYRTVNQPRQVTVTQTVTSSCGYNYDAPAVPFNF